MSPSPSFKRPATSPAITATVLPSLGRGSSRAEAINDQGVIVGYSTSEAGVVPVKWTSAGGSWIITQLQTTPGSARDVNESGAAVGQSGGMAMYWPAAGGAQSIGSGDARAMNESDVVVGQRNGAPNGGAVAWTRSGAGWVEHTLPRQVGVSSGFNEVDDVNNAGVIVGYAQGTDGIQHAVKWVPSVTSPGEWEPAVPLDAHAGATNSAAMGIDGSDMVGVVWRCTPALSETCTSTEPYHWSLTGAGLGSLSTAAAAPMGLNASRYVVGWFNTSLNQLRAFVWSPANPVIRDLGLPKGHAAALAFDVNNTTATRATKQAVGELQLSRGGSAAVVWSIP